ncbi:DUF5590 domain-containing protein [Gorillibacterium massiliense]|uniref:cell wall elongation regulator TseB-like domain-containing protein n=1 Tax=Gorillibacterium massiliense TaxID=1280390 RepID=UPI0004B1910B|nr:DUF5590 domain-containing protein [Gorillibacterium massiliense]
MNGEYRLKLRSKKRKIGKRQIWLIVSISVIVLIGLIIGLERFYSSIQNDYFAEKKAAIRTAKEQTDLVKAGKVAPFVGDKDYMTVQGTSSDGKSMVVWISDDGVHAEYLDQGFSKDAVREKTKAQYPGVTILRIIPAVYEGEYSWQVYYRLKENGVTSYFYDYLNIHTGDHLDTWSLSLHNK